MAKFARRSIMKTTYAPIRPTPEDASLGASLPRRRALDKVVFAHALRATRSEIEAAERKLIETRDEEAIGVLQVLRLADERGALPRSRWPALAVYQDAPIARAGRAVAAVRRDRRQELVTEARAIAEEHLASLGGGAHAPIPLGHDATVGNGSSTHDHRRSAASWRPAFAAAVDWIRVRDPGRADRVGALACSVAGVPTRVRGVSVDTDAVLTGVLGTIEDTPVWTEELVDGFEERMKVEPIGRLHLERVDMTPIGIVRGELMHSIGLAPAETVTLIHREWSSRETTFEKVVTDEIEQTKEEGVTESTELATATETQARHSSSLRAEASGSAGWGWGSASVSMGYSSTSDSERTRRDSRNHAIDVTSKAAARTRKEHKVTFTIKEQAGVEDEAVRTLTNPSTTAPMRIDLHQMLRRWQVDLYRYGLRLTYDIVVPAPGVDLLAKVDELRRIDYELSQPFAFSLTAGEITRGKWQDLASRYGADVTPPPPESMQLTKRVLFPAQTQDEAKADRFDAIEFDVPSGFYVADGRFAGFVTMYPGGHFHIPAEAPAPIGHTGPEVRSYHTDLVSLRGRTGHMAVVMFGEGIAGGHAEATLDAVLSTPGWNAWQSEALNAMRRGAQELWALRRQDLQQRRERLTEEIGRWDPLTLRRMEREEIMKTTLKWLFGPAFDLMPDSVSQHYGGEIGGLARIEPSRLTTAQWAEVMGAGEFVKFLHQAIEWENVLFSVYPYFWDHPRNHEFKRFLHHPDSTHQTFLRAGAARVVLTVRPGFEEAFTKLVETGTVDGDLGSHPYLTIAEELRAYAEAHYPGIPGVQNGQLPDPAAVEAAERGEHIARWFEHTPVSALDISVNTPLADLR